MLRRCARSQWIGSAHTRSVSEGEVHVVAGEGRRSHMYTHCILRPHATVSQRVHECDELICREQSRCKRGGKRLASFGTGYRHRLGSSKRTSHRRVADEEHTCVEGHAAMRGFRPASRTIWAKKADGGFVHAAKDRTPGAIAAGHSSVSSRRSHSVERRVLKNSSN